MTNECLNVTNKGLYVKNDSYNVTNEGSNMTNKGLSVTNDSVFENWKVSSNVTWGGSGLSKVSDDFFAIWNNVYCCAWTWFWKAICTLLIFFYSLFCCPTKNDWGILFNKKKIANFFSVWGTKSSVNNFYKVCNLKWIVSSFLLILLDASSSQTSN